MKNSNIFIAFFSRSGDNYVAGRIENLPVGNTAVIAKKIQALTGGELFEIKTVQSYPADYTQTTKVARDELRKNARPELAATVQNINTYEIIFLGFPNWWGTMPMALYTFLDSYDLAGKTIIPFCTHEGSGIGSSEDDIRTLCPTAQILPGIAITGSSAARADDDVERWLKKTGVSTNN